MSESRPPYIPGAKPRELIDSLHADIETDKSGDEQVQCIWDGKRWFVPCDDGFRRNKRGRLVRFDRS
jgi:hypothetical protein